MPGQFAAVATECLVAANSPLRAALLAAWLCLDRARICDALMACQYFCTTYSRTSCVLVKVVIPARFEGCTSLTSIAPSRHRSIAPFNATN